MNIEFKRNSPTVVLALSSLLFVSIGGLLLWTGSSAAHSPLFPTGAYSAIYIGSGIFALGYVLFLATLLSGFLSVIFRARRLSREVPGSSAGNTALIIFVMAHALPVHMAQADDSLRAKEYNAEIEPLVGFLKKQKRAPVDYIMGLFEMNDLVILCERDHRETTQYDLIYELVSDERFIANVGHIFTEVGTSSLRQDVHEFLFAKDLSESEIEQRALEIYRDIEYAPMWDKHNFFDFLKRLYLLNNSQPVAQKLELHFSDVPFSWEGMTAEKYREFSATLDSRDRTMATQIIDKFNEIRASEAHRKKALVIMNSAHAFNDQVKLAGPMPSNTLAGQLLFEAYPGEVANVMLNFMRHGGEMGLVHGGKWDAAFEATGNRNLGFDLATSPFGRDTFDYIPGTAKGLTYADVFTGFVFYKPLEEFKIAIGVPGLTDDDQGKQIIARYAIAGRPLNEADAKSLISAFSSESGKVHRYTYNDKGIFGDPQRAAPLREKDKWLKR